MNPAVIIIADCLPGYHHPEGHLDLCVANVVASVPTLSGWGIAILSLLVALVVSIGFRGWKQ